MGNKLSKAKKTPTLFALQKQLVSVKSKSEIKEEMVKQLGIRQEPIKINQIFSYQGKQKIVYPQLEEPNQVSKRFTFDTQIIQIMRKSQSNSMILKEQNLKKKEQQKIPEKSCSFNNQSKKQEVLAKKYKSSCRTNFSQIKASKIQSLDRDEVYIKSYISQNQNNKQQIKKIVEITNIYENILKQQNFKKAVQRIQEIQFENQDVASLLCDQIMNQPFTDKQMKLSESLVRDYTKKIEGNQDCVELVILVLKKYLEELGAMVVIQDEPTLRSALTIKAFSTGFMMNRIKCVQEIEEGQWSFQSLKESPQYLQKFEKYYKQKVFKQFKIKPENITIHKLTHCCIAIEYSTSNVEPLLAAAQGNKKNKKLKLHPYFKYFQLCYKNFDPKGNIKFFDKKDSIQWRGNWPYYQPTNCKRYGLSVSKKYDRGDDTWLKMDNVKNQWAVAFHGANQAQLTIKNIINGLDQGQMLRAGQRQKCQHKNALNKVGQKVGKGVYCTPHIHYACGYASPYQINKKSYVLIFQCRVNPQAVKVCESYQHQWVLNNSKDIRPYGIILMKKQTASAYPHSKIQFKEIFLWNKYKDQIQKRISQKPKQK